MLWDAYIASFHSEKPGITEEVLALSYDSDGMTPYQWMGETLPEGSSVLDVACGSAPLLRTGWGGDWHGIDRSREEIARIPSAWRASALIGSIDSLPFEREEFDAVVCSMALMIVDPFFKCLAEMMRVLRKGGLFIALLPGSTTGMTAFERMRWGRLMLALHIPRLAYPNSSYVQHLPSLLHTAGADHVTVTDRCYRYSIDSPAMGERLVQSLYLPGVSPARLKKASDRASQWVGVSMPLPIQQIVATKRG